MIPVVEELFAAFDSALLDQPLRQLPDDLADGEAVIIARWVGPRWGALLGLINTGPDEDDGELTVHLDATSFRRLPDGWEGGLTSGGTNWWTTEKPLLRRRELDARSWTLHHFHTGHGDQQDPPWAIGVAGQAAAWVEVTDMEGPVRRRLEAPLGAFVVAWNPDGPATVELFDQAGSSLSRVDVPRVR